MLLLSDVLAQKELIWAYNFCLNLSPGQDRTSDRKRYEKYLSIF
jgi:hypothetical protein